MSLDRCDACGARFAFVPRAPLLANEIRARLAMLEEGLCARCCFDRARQRRVVLTTADLVVCQFNRRGAPSWFALFQKAGLTPARWPQARTGRWTKRSGCA